MRQLEQAVVDTTPIPVSNMADQRKHRRRLCLDGGVIRLAIRPEFRGRRALLVDVSTGGIGFVLEDALEAETKLVFEWKAPGEIQSVTRIAHVRHCRQHPTPPDAPWLPPTPLLSNIFRRMFGSTPPPPEKDAWLVGCEFDRPLDEVEIQYFVQAMDIS